MSKLERLIFPERLDLEGTDEKVEIELENLQVFNLKAKLLWIHLELIHLVLVDASCEDLGFIDPKKDAPLLLEKIQK